MTWQYFIDKHETEINKKFDVISGTWWTTDIDKIEVQLTNNAIHKLNETWLQAFNNNKPFTFFLVNNIKSRWRIINSEHNKEFYMSQYSDSVFTKYDPDKINKLQTNSIGSYYSVPPMPKQLKDFIENTESNKMYKYFCNSCKFTFYEMNLLTNCPKCNCSVINIVTTLNVI